MSDDSHVFCFLIHCVLRSILKLHILKQTSRSIINAKKNNTHILIKICHIEQNNNFGILVHNRDIPFFFCHNGNSLFFGIFTWSGICGISHFCFATMTILSYFGTLGYPDFNLPHLECTWNWDIGGKWDIPKKSATTKNGIWHLVGYPISHSRHNTWMRKV